MYCSLAKRSHHARMPGILACTPHTAARRRAPLTCDIVASVAAIRQLTQAALHDLGRPGAVVGQVGSARVRRLHAVPQKTVCKQPPITYWRDGRRSHRPVHAVNHGSNSQIMTVISADFTGGACRTEPDTHCEHPRPVKRSLVPQPRPGACGRPHTGPQKGVDQRISGHWTRCGE